MDNSMVPEVEIAWEHVQQLLFTRLGQALARAAAREDDEREYAELRRRSARSVPSDAPSKSKAPRSAQS